MTTLVHVGTVAADTAAANAGKRAKLASLALIALTAGLISAFVYSQFGQVHFAPTFAKELTQASEARTEVGDREGALAASRKATEVYRRLMRMSAIHYAPYLAASLHNLSARLSEAGDSAGALAAIDEAIRIRRQLAKSDPARYAAKLEQSMQLLAQIEAMYRSEASTMMIAANPGR